MPLLKECETPTLFRSEYRNLVISFECSCFTHQRQYILKEKRKSGGYKISRRSFPGICPPAGHGPLLCCTWAPIQRHICGMPGNVYFLGVSHMLDTRRYWVDRGRGIQNKNSQKDWYPADNIHIQYLAKSVHFLSRQRESQAFKVISLQNCFPRHATNLRHFLK